MIKLIAFLCLSFFLITANAKSAPWVGITLGGGFCTGKGQGFGPYDYRLRASMPEKNLGLVERAHFNSNVERLVKGQSGDLIADIDYTLRAWPNHHRALKSIMRYQLELEAKIRKGKKPNTPVECYFQRAINFSPKDVTTLSLYGRFLRKSGHLQKAKQIYQKALKVAPKNRKIAYAYSFLLIDLKEYEEALKYARLVYEKGKAPNKLKNKLKKLGVWE
jgi:tetratricopeptide (TPR) repeat protein